MEKIVIHPLSVMTIFSIPQRRYCLIILNKSENAELQLSIYCGKVLGKKYLLCFSVLWLLCLCARLFIIFMCFVVTCWERADLLALGCGV